MRRVRRGLAAALALWVLAAFSQVSWGKPPAESLLRLSWRTNGEKIKVPRPQDPNLPAHMRLPEGQAFDEKIRPYLLQLKVDGSLRAERRILAPGWRHDRPLSVLEELALPPGRHSVEVHFIPEGVVEPAPFQSDLEFAAGRVVLITLDENGSWRCVNGATGG